MAAREPEPPLVFVPIDQAGLRELESWFDDEELRRRIEPPSTRWFAYVTSTPGVCAWMVHGDGEPIGQVQLDIEDGVRGHVAAIVKPALRGRGYGTSILRALLLRREMLGLRELIATAEVDHAAAHRCLLGAGFTLRSPEPDEDGFLHFIRLCASPA